MSGYAVVVNGVVVNMIRWDGVTEWSPSEGEAILAPDGVSKGWSYADGIFTAPPPPELTQEEVAAANLVAAQSEYDRATVQITALNEQVEDADYDGTTEEAVKAELTAWTNYRKQLRAYIKAGDGSQALPSSLFS